MAANDVVQDQVIAWAHNVAQAEDGLLRMVADVVQREFAVLPTADIKAIRKAAHAAVMAAVEEMKVFLTQLYDAARRMMKAIVQAHVGSSIRVMEGSVKTRGLIPYTPAVARQRVAALANTSRWKEQTKRISKRTQSRVRRILADALAKGQLPSEIEARLESEISSPRDWEGFVRTAIQQVNNAAQRDMYDENEDVIGGIQYVGTLDTRTCIVCAADDGKIFWHEPRDGQLSKSDAPSTPRHIRCRCNYVPILRSAEDLARRAGVKLSPDAAKYLDGQAAERKSYSQWLSKMDEGTKRAALGARRYDLYSRGVPITQFAAGGRALTAEQLQGLTPGEIFADDQPETLINAGLDEWWDKNRASQLIDRAPSPSPTVTAAKKPTTIVGTRPRVEVVGDKATVETLVKEVNARQRKQNYGAKARSQMLFQVDRRTVQSYDASVGAAIRRSSCVVTSQSPEETAELALVVANQLGLLADIRVANAPVDWPKAWIRVTRSADGERYYEEISDTPRRGRGWRVIRVPPGSLKTMAAQAQRLTAAESASAPIVHCPHGPMRAVSISGRKVKYKCDRDPSHAESVMIP